VEAVGRGEDATASVGARSVLAGVALCTWFAGEARRIYATLSESSADRETRTLVEFIRSRGGSITARVLQRSNSRKYANAETASAVLNDLAEAGLGEWAEPQPSECGGRPKSRCFTLHPTPDKTDKTPGAGEDDDEDAPDTTSDKTPADP
jgi:hypothetical protein